MVLERESAHDHFPEIIPDKVNLRRVRQPIQESAIFSFRSGTNLCLSNALSKAKFDEAVLLNPFACAGGLSKEEVIETNERLRAVRIRLDSSYDTAKRALVELMARYANSKNVRNVFQRYNLLKEMIKVSMNYAFRGISFTLSRMKIH